MSDWMKTVPPEAVEEFQAWLKNRQQQRTPNIVIDEDQCPHDELDHGICLDCGQDRFDDLIDRADMMGDD